MSDDSQQFAKLREHVEHLLYAIDRGYFSDCLCRQVRSWNRFGPMRNRGYAPVEKIA